MPAAVRYTEEIRSDVMEQLAWDTRVDSSSIEVDVVDDTVILSGTVPTCSERNQAQTDALQVPGVNDVDNRLVVSFPFADVIPVDSEISFNVSSELTWNPGVEATRIHIAVNQGVVTLSGVVDSYWQKHRVEEIAANTAGVTDVWNDLTVAPAVADEDVRREILAAIEGNTGIDVDRLNVEVNNGVVTLTGTVDDYAEFRAVRDAARYTSGVLEVNNSLTIDSQAT